MKIIFVVFTMVLFFNVMGCYQKIDNIIIKEKNGIYWDGIDNKEKDSFFV